MSVYTLAIDPDFWPMCLLPLIDGAWPGCAPPPVQPGFFLSMLIVIADLEPDAASLASSRTNEARQTDDPGWSMPGGAKPCSTRSKPRRSWPYLIVALGLVLQPPRSLSFGGRLNISDRMSDIPDDTVAAKAPPRRPRRTSDHIPIAFQQACDHGDLEVAEQLLGVVQIMITAPPLPRGGRERRRRNREPGRSTRTALRRRVPV
jgi:hypothetical protein